MKGAKFSQVFLGGASFGRSGGAGFSFESFFSPLLYIYKKPQGKTIPGGTQENQKRQVGAGGPVYGGLVV